MQSAHGADATAEATRILDRIRTHEFYPIVMGFTKDPDHEHKDGVADFGAEDWEVRLLAIRDLVRLGPDAVPALLTALDDDDRHVQHVGAFVLGLLGGDGVPAALMETLEGRKDSVVRSQAAVSLGQLHAEEALPLLDELAENEENRDVRVQSELAAHRIRTKFTLDEDPVAAFAELDPADFNRLRVGEPPPDFTLRDTNGNEWRLSDHLGKQPIALIWIFSDWCPVCHGEFHELIELREQFEANNIEVVTIQAQDLFRSRVMTGQEITAKYWFATRTPIDRYTDTIWWPHLVDTAGAVGARYGVQPMAFTVHAEWINRPATILIDGEGITRMAYTGTFWGDRPSIHEMLDMIVEKRYDYKNPRRLTP